MKSYFNLPQTKVFWKPANAILQPWAAELEPSHPLGIISGPGIGTLKDEHDELLHACHFKNKNKN